MTSQGSQVQSLPRPPFFAVQNSVLVVAAHIRRGSARRGCRTVFGCCVWPKLRGRLDGWSVTPISGQRAPKAAEVARVEARGRGAGWSVMRHRSPPERRLGDWVPARAASPLQIASDAIATLSAVTLNRCPPPRADRRRTADGPPGSGQAGHVARIRVPRARSQSHAAAAAKSAGWSSPSTEPPCIARLARACPPGAPQQRRPVELPVQRRAADDRRYSRGAGIARRAVCSRPADRPSAVTPTWSGQKGTRSRLGWSANRILRGRDQQVETAPATRAESRRGSRACRPRRALAQRARTAGTLRWPSRDGQVRRRARPATAAARILRVRLTSERPSRRGPKPAQRRCSPAA